MQKVPGSGFSRQKRQAVAAVGVALAGDDTQQSSSPSSQARVIAVYNYKGGVAKTTTIINIASVLAHDMNKRVLLVDCDPQCNLTCFFQPESRQTLNEEKDAAVNGGQEGGKDEPATGDGMPEAQAHESYDEEPGGAGGAAQSGPPTPIVPSHMIYPEVSGMDVTIIRQPGNIGGVAGAGNKQNIFQLLNPLFTRFCTSISKDYITNLKPIALDGGEPDTDGSRLWLIPGSSDMIKLEKVVGLADTIGERAQLIRMGFRRILNQITEAKNIDIVLVDFGPSASLMNTVFLSTCDFILPPCFADYFSVASLDGLLFSVLPRVLELRDSYMALENQSIQALKESFLDDDGKPMSTSFFNQFRFPQNPPRLLFAVSRLLKTLKSFQTHH